MNNKQTNMQGQWSLTFHVAAFRRKKAKFAWKQIRKWFSMAQTLSHVSSISMQIFVELYLKPVVDLIQCKLSSAGLIDCLKKFLFRIVLTSRLDSIAVSVFVFILVEFDQYRIWDEQACLLKITVANWCYWIVVFNLAS